MPTLTPSPVPEPAGPAPPLAPPLARSPLAGPLHLTGGFGEYRGGHFHAGVDLSTGEKVGLPVFAPLAGWIERVRASGVGYGRSLYLRAADGRVVVLGHLDAFAEPIGSFVAAAQDSNGDYEQDLWPAAGRLRVRAGQRIAWSGESGAGGPHLHVEIRRGDMAYNPLRAGLRVRDRRAPRLPRLTLEPLDDTSYVRAGAAPLSLNLGAAVETVTVEGRVRAVVGARDGEWRGVDRMIPWSTVIDWEGMRVECRFDSVSWATDMPEVDYVYDTGRIVGGKGLVMWAPPHFRPRVIETSAPLAEEAGTITVRPGDPPRALRISALDLGGNAVARIVVLRPPAPGRGGPDTTRAGGAPRVVQEGTNPFEYAMLPGRNLRLSFRGAPVGSRGVRVVATQLTARGEVSTSHPATWDGSAWTAVVPVGRSVQVRFVGRDAVGHSWSKRMWGLLWDEECYGFSSEPPFWWEMPPGGTIEPTCFVMFWSFAPYPLGTAELTPVGFSYEVLPTTLPLRKPVRWHMNPGVAGVVERRMALYRDGGDGWTFLRACSDSLGGCTWADVRGTGRFAFFADTVPPRVRVLTPPHTPEPGPYSRWTLRAVTSDGGSGIDARRSRFVVDGRAVPTEWDPEDGQLRWRPLHPPPAGKHAYQLTAQDRAGNVTVGAGSFVIR